MTRALKRLARLAAAVLSFAYLILVLNTIQMLSVLVYPVSRRAFRAVNRWCARSIWGLWVIMAEVQNGIALRFTGDPIVPRENVLVLPNHQTMADVLVVMCFAWRSRRVGDMKWFVKDVIKYFPGFGWGMKFLDCVFVKRDWDRDEAQIRRLFAKYKAESIPIFLVSFLEGTRRTDAKQERAREFARARGLPVPTRTLVPRTKGFVATVHGLRDHLDAVVDLTVAYPGRVPDLVDCFDARVERIDVHVRRYPIAALPADDEGLARWAVDRFREKDELLDGHAREGAFPGAPLPGEVRVRDWFRPEASRRLGEPGRAPAKPS